MGYAIKPSFRASESDRTLTCNGSITLVPLVKKREGDDGDEGSALHHASATALCKDHGAVAELPLPDPKWPNLKFSQWIAAYYVRHIAATAPDGWSLECEVALEHEFARFILTGHIDCVALSPDALEAIIYDLKTGYNYVDEAEYNWQMFCYAVLLLMAYPSLRKIKIYVVQPRADEDMGFERITPCVIKGDRLARSAAVLEQHFNAAIDNRMELNSGKKQCRFCPVKLQCWAYKAMKIKITEQMLAAIKAEPDDATLAEWVLASKALAPGFDEAEELAKERIAAIGEIFSADGQRITVKTSKGSYSIKDKAALWTTLRSLLPEDKLALCAKWSVAELKDAIAEHMNIPKSGKGAMTAENVFAVQAGTFMEQGTRATFIFS